MPLFSITGLSGTGKSTLNIELKARGFESYDGDEDGLAKWYDTKTGLWLPNVPIEDCIPEFLLTHSRDIPRTEVEKLAARSRHEDKKIFLCGAHENEGELQDLFDLTFGLVLEKDELVYRLTTRATNEWGKRPHELAYSLAFGQKWHDNCRRFDYIKIDASQPTRTIADLIVERTDAYRLV